MASLEELKARSGYVCEYCWQPGELGQTLEIRHTLTGTVCACKDTSACDARWAAQNPEDDH